MSNVAVLSTSFYLVLIMSQLPYNLLICVDLITHSLSSRIPYWSCMWRKKNLFIYHILSLTRRVHENNILNTNMYQVVSLILSIWSYISVWNKVNTDILNPAQKGGLSHSLDSMTDCQLKMMHRTKVLALFRHKQRDSDLNPRHTFDQISLDK